MSEHPHLTLIKDETERAENNLNGFRDRALRVLTASAGIVTLLTGLVAFAASRAEEDQGLPESGSWLVAAALILFVCAGVVALFANLPANVDRVSGNGLRVRTARDRWSGSNDAIEHAEREVAEVLVSYMVSLRVASDRASKLLFAAIAIQMLGIAFAATAAFEFLDSLG